MNEPRSLSTGERIATLRQFFRSRRGSADALGMPGGTGDNWAPTLWPETEWSDTRFELDASENG